MPIDPGSSQSAAQQRTGSSKPSDPCVAHFLFLPVFVRLSEGQRANRKAAERGPTATFLVKDALVLNDFSQRFDTVIDSDLLNVFNDEDMRLYLEGLTTVMKPGGRLLRLFFSDEEPGTQRPRSKEELHTAFAEGWSIESINPTRFEVCPDLKDMSFSQSEPKAWFVVIWQGSVIR